MHWVNDYIGLPWVAYARGNGAYDCWGLVLDVLKRFFNVDASQYLSVKTDSTEQINAAKEIERESGRFIVVDSPVSGAVACCYVMQDGREMVRHVGIYLDIDGGGILHAAENHSVAFDPPSKLNRIFHRIEYLCPAQLL